MEEHPGDQRDAQRYRPGDTQGSWPVMSATGGCEQLHSMKWCDLLPNPPVQQRSSCREGRLSPGECSAEVAE